MKMTLWDSLFTCKTIGFANESISTMSADILKSQALLSALTQHVAASCCLEQSAFMFNSGTPLDKLLSFFVVGMIVPFHNATFEDYGRRNAEMVARLSEMERDILEHLNREFERNALEVAHNQELQSYYKLVVQRHAETINMLKTMLDICGYLVVVATHRRFWWPHEMMAIVAFCNAIGNDTVRYINARNNGHAESNDLEAETNGIIDELMANRNIIYESKEERGYIGSIYDRICHYNEINKDFTAINENMIRTEQSFAFRLCVLKLFVTLDTFEVHRLMEVKDVAKFACEYATRLKKIQHKIDKLDLTRLKLSGHDHFVERDEEIASLDESQPAFEVQPFRFAYSEKSERVLNVTRAVHVPSKAWTFFQGNSGAGKTTFVHLLLKLLAPGEVDVAFFGHRQYSCSAIRDHVRFVKSKGDIFNNRTVEFNVTFGVHASSTMSEDDITGTIARYFAIFQLGDYKEVAHKLICHMSTGEQQRVKIVRLIVSTLADPRRSVWIMDEMTSNVDAAIEEVILRELKRIQRALGLSVIHISHNPASRHYCDYYMRIDEERSIVVSQN
jgi:ABC-type multidrug transport system ATPase subunit